MFSLSQRAFAEVVGTFILVVCGCGAVAANVETAALGHAGVALTWGLVVLALVYTFGDVSGAHLNPAVTIGFVAAGRFRVKEALWYIPAQFLGALIAAAALRLLFPEDTLLGSTLPRGGDAGRSFAFETFLTWFLMLAVLRVSTGAKEKGITAGIAVGAIIGLEAMFAGPLCGASMNPARSVGPAVVSGHLEHLWVYLAAPPLGALLAVATDRLLSPSPGQG